MRKKLLETWEKLALIALGIVCAYKMRGQVIEGAFASKKALENVWSDIKNKIEKERKLLTVEDDKENDQKEEKSDD